MAGYRDHQQPKGTCCSDLGRLQIRPMWAAQTSTFIVVCLVGTTWLFGGRLDRIQLEGVLFNERSSQPR